MRVHYHTALQNRLNFISELKRTLRKPNHVNLNEICGDVGVDVLSFGGTKNGMMFGDAVIFFDKKLSKNFEFFRKQGMHLTSKFRFISLQFEP